MPKPLRHSPGGIVFHCLNRGNARGRIFEDERDYVASTAKGPKFRFRDPT